MYYLSIGLIALIAIEHIYILVLEMFLWDKPAGMRAFKMSEQKAKESKVLAANQGLYNGFLAAGLIWSLFESNIEVAFKVQIFFLSCILIAGIYGGFTAVRSILWIQALPAFIALFLVLLS